MADPSRTASVGDGLDGLKRVGLPASAHQRPVGLAPTAVLGLRPRDFLDLHRFPLRLLEDLHALAMSSRIDQMKMRLVALGVQDDGGAHVPESTEPTNATLVLVNDSVVPIQALQSRHPLLHTGPPEQPVEARLSLLLRGLDEPADILGQVLSS